ncbi:MAG TPA: CBS domain-containing protein [Bacteriovoracaceae bacterium]|nr:CBS domain-containing protein [Bacteriovoracaceae bacterium]
MQVSEVMSKGIVSVTSLDSVRKVAKLMKEKDVGAIPIIEKGQPVGFVTDRDIVINCVASGYNLDGPVSHAMTENVISVTEDQDVTEVSRLMQQNQVSRIVVTDKEHHPVGMVGLQDLTLEDEDIAAETISKIKQ